MNMTKEELYKKLIKNSICEVREKILRLVSDNEGITNTEAHQKLKISMPLLSYHLNGNLKSEGMIQLGLITRIHDDRGISTGFKVTELGKEALEILKTGEKK